MKKNKKITEISELGEFKFIEKITNSFEIKKNETIMGIGDDSAVLNFNSNDVIISNDILIEGIHFDLTYNPLKHLGYKAVIVNLSDIYAMNAQPSHIILSIGLSNRFSVEAIQELYDGVLQACKNYSVDLVGGDTSSSKKGLIISVTAIGSTKRKKITYRNNAKPNDLIVVSGDLGGAYMGLQILEREKSVFIVNPNSKPDLSNYSYSIQRFLKPEARKDIIKLLHELNIFPTSMIDISDGLSSDLIHIAKNSKAGFNLFEDKIPIDEEVKRISEEFKINSTTAALNGGEDYELLFTINQKDYEKIKKIKDLSIIGHITKSRDRYLINKIGQKIALNSQGWDTFK